MSTAHSLARAVACELAAALPSEVGLGADDIVDLLAKPPKPELGDVAFPCFKLARVLRKAPPKIAAELVPQLQGALSDTSLIAKILATGPYLNFTLDPGRAGAHLLPALAGEGSAIGAATQDERLMVEFSQPNTHKALHVGHLRNMCLGDSLVRLLRSQGYPVIAANYFGDVGTHIARCLWWYIDHLSEEQRQPPADNRGEWLGKIYTKAAMALADWEEAGKTDPAAAKRLAEAKARITEILQRLEAREPEITKVWDETKKWSLDDFEEIYRYCDIHFDVRFYESQADEPGLEIVEEFLQKGVFEVSQGAVGIFNPEVKHMPFFMLRKQDGTSLYATKDLALAKLKFDGHNIDRSIYVVDVRQSDHFRHVFLTLEKMGFAQAKACQHVPYEMVELPDGPMGARKGNVVLFRALREQMTARITELHLEKFRGQWSDAEIAQAAHEVALGAIKYGMLARDVNQKIVFDMEAWLDVRGNTGPYLQYVHARACSIIRECALQSPVVRVEQHTNAAVEACKGLTTLEERELRNALDRFVSTVKVAADELRPSVLCTYLYELSKQFNRFYLACKVKGSPEPLRTGRILLVQATISVLAEGLGLLGIPAPQRM